MSKIQLDQSMIVMSIFPIFTLSQKRQTIQNTSDDLEAFFISWEYKNEFFFHLIWQHW